MKQIKIYAFITLFALLTVIPSHAQQIIGTWFGVVKINDTSLRLLFNIAQNEGKLSGTLISIDQSDAPIPVSSIQFENSKLTLAIANIAFAYSGELMGDSIVGFMTQGLAKLPLNLNKKTFVTTEQKRPQDPVKPYPYTEEEVAIQNGSVTLAATLTLPNSNQKCPAVLLVSGSGPHNRDEERMLHCLFLVIADYLTRNGIAALRYDDRAYLISNGDFASSISFYFATHA